MAEHYDLGKEGEQEAVYFLERNGYQILERNWRYQKAEIDIIAKKEDKLIVVEVKTRSSDFYGNPEEAISSKKIKLLVEATDAYIHKHDLDLEVQFDSIAIVKHNSQFQIEHTENAFFYF